ncbi:hypothetical protein [Bacteriophage Phobos]|uniref:Uncharacterized protein n=1 Tax=Bacteriophage Phobos TaxID=2662138 RepID=A0A5Q2U9W5_9CAUD|nr:hypothetical protein JT319_gp54 [Bacteriophage Phobos]QGH45023.1 hypothetical protein [Bacteriophage Phobos]
MSGPRWMRRGWANSLFGIGWPALALLTLIGGESWPVVALGGVLSVSYIAASLAGWLDPEC